LTGHGATVVALAVSPDGRTLASCDADRVTKLWSVATGRELMTLARGADVAQFAFLSEGDRLAGFSSGGAVRTWSAR